MNEEDPYKNYPKADASIRRLETCFGPDGKKSIPCDKKCGREINVHTFNAFMLPEDKGYEVLFVCLHCCKQLYTDYNYGNKN